jgi:WD40 repeat protein
MSSSQPQPLGGSDGQAAVTEGRYDAFISYHHGSSGGLVRQLHWNLERFGNPWFRARQSRVFYDRQSLSLTPDLWKSLERALESSEWLVLVATPEAAVSTNVNREVRWWLMHRSPARLLLVLADGVLAWDEVEHQWDQEASDALPRALVEVARDVPLWADLRKDKSRQSRQQDIGRLVAQIRGVPADELLGRHVRSQRMARRLVVATALILAAAIMVAVSATRAAKTEADMARSRELAATAISLLEDGQIGGSLMALESVRTVPTKEGLAAASRVLSRPSHNGTSFDHGPGLGTFDRQVNAVAFSPDSTVLASAGVDGMVRLWDTVKRKSLGVLTATGRQLPVWSVAFSPDGAVVASAGEDGRLRLWNVRTMKEQSEPIVAHGGSSVQSVAFAPGGELLASAGADGTVRLWNVRSMRLAGAELRTDAAPLDGVSFDASGKVLIATREDGGVLAWDLVTRRGITLLQPNDETTSVAADPAGHLIAAGGEDGRIRLWDVVTQQPIGPPINADGGAAIWRVTFSPDSAMIAYATVNGRLRLWDIATHQPASEPLVGPVDTVEDLAFSPDGHYIASASADGSVRLWEAASQQPLGEVLPSSSSEPVLAVAFSPNSEFAASAGDDGIVRFWDARTRLLLTQPSLEHSSPVTAIAFSPDGEAIATADEERIRFWRVATGQPFGEPIENQDGSPVRGLDFSPSGTVLASAQSIGTVQFWSAKGRRPIGRPIVIGGEYSAALAFSPNGKMLATVGGDGKIRLWDSTTRQSIGPVLNDSDSISVESVGFSPNGRTVVSGGSDGTVRLWDVVAGEAFGEPLRGHEGTPVWAARFSADGKLVGSVGEDATLRLWDTLRREQLGVPLVSHGGSPVWGGLAFSQDGRFMATGNHDGTTQLWITPSHWVRAICKVAGRNLTQAEWDEWIGEDEVYVRHCADSPSGWGAPPKAPPAEYPDPLSAPSDKPPSQR